MESRPFYSIVIPLYNRREIIFETISSVIIQTFKNFEIIIIDDGSTDHPQEIINSINEPRLKYFRQSNSGGSAARNAGIDLAKGEYIAFLDSDDKFLANKLEKLYEIIPNNPADVYFSYTIVDRGRGVTGLKPSRPLRTDEPVDEYLFSDYETIQTSTMVLRAEIAKTVRFKDGLKKGQDLDFAVRLYRYGAKFHFVHEPLTEWLDCTYQGRVSHNNHADALETWLSENKPILSSRAYFGFRANILSYEIAKQRPIQAAIDIAKGVLFGGVSPKRAMHSAARAFIPRSIYRRMVDFSLKKSVMSRLPMKRYIFILFFLVLLFFIAGKNASSYEGREINAGWRLKAKEQINIHRKADLSIFVFDKNKKVITGANVHLKMMRHTFAFGAAVRVKTLMSNNSDSERYRKSVARLYNKIVLENDLKWGPWTSSENNSAGSQFYYPNTLEALQWAKSNHIIVRGHYISWGPIDKYVLYKTNQDNPEVFRNALFEHVREKLPKVNKFIHEWDAVNHPIGWNDQLVTLGGVFGQSIYIDIFKLAKELSPQAKLYVNEGSILPTTSYNIKIRDKYANLIRYLLDNGAPLNGIGFMGHFDHDKLTPPSELVHIFDRFAAFGLPLQVTEFDVRFGKKGEPYDFSDEELQLQADYTRDFMTAAFSHPAIEGIVMWGFWEGQHYNPSAALYRKDWAIKPNGKIWEDLVFRQWWTDVRGQTDRGGNFKTRGFLGEYEITVEYQGKTMTRSARLSKGGNRISFIID